MKSDVINPSKLAQTAKFWVAVVYSVLVAVSAVALPDPLNKYVATALLIVGPIAVYLKGNAPVEKPLEPPTLP